MRHTLAVAALLLLSAPSALAAEKVFPFPYQRATLPNGLTVLMIPTPSPGLVSYFTVVRTGSRDEPERGRSGYAHFFEHMMFRGTKRHPGPVYDRIVTSLGAQANATTTDDLTMFFLTFTKGDLEKVIDIESDRFQNLDYGEREFQTESSAVYGEYRIGATQPWIVLNDKLHDVAFDVHPYKHTTIGFEADIKEMPKGYEFSRAFYKRFYRPENVVIMVAGDIDPAATLKLIEKYYGPWQPGYQAPQIPAEPPQTAPRSARIVFPGRTLPILDIAYKCDAFDPANRDYVAARLLGELAFGPESELYKKLVLREQRVETIGGEVPMNRDPSLIDIAAVVKNVGDVDAIQTEIRAALSEFKTKPVDAKRLDDLKRRNRFGFLMGLDAPNKVTQALARFVALTGGIEVVDQWFEACDKVTPEDIMNAANKYFVPERRTVVLLVSEADSKKPTSSAKPLAASPKEETSPKQPVKPDDSAKPQANDENAKPQAAGNPTSEILDLKSFILLPVPSDPTISIRLWFKVGSQDDPPGKEGLAAITAAMISQGATKSNSYEQILDKLFPLAASYSDTTSVEQTVFHGRVHKDNLDRFYPLFLQAILEPAFEQEDLDRIKSQTLNYLENSLRYSSDEELGKALLYNTIFDNPVPLRVSERPEIVGIVPGYSHLTEGTLTGVRSVTLDDVKKFYRRHYGRNNVVVGLGGAYENALVDRLQHDLASMPINSKEIEEGAILHPPKRARRVTIVEKDCRATAISLGFPLDVHRDQKDWYALALANSWLGQHRNQNGHLYQVIREARGLNYGDYTYLEYFPNAAHQFVPPTNVCRYQQIFEMWIRPVPNATRHFAIRAALREFEHFVDHGLTEEQFQETRNFLRKFVLHLAPTTNDRLGYAMDDRFYGFDSPMFPGDGPRSHLERYPWMLDMLTLADVNAAIKEHLQYKDLQIVFITKDAKALKEALVNETPSPIKYPSPKPESVLSEDRQISVYPLGIKAENVRIVPVTDLFEK